MKPVVKITIAVVLIAALAFIPHVQSSKEVQTAYDPGGGRK